MPAVTIGSQRAIAVRVTAFAGRTVPVAAFGLLALAALSSSACIDVASGAEKVDPAAFTWNAPVSAPSTVFVRNTNGTVEVQPATDGNVQRDRRGALAARRPQARRQVRDRERARTARRSARCGTAGRAARPRIIRAAAACRAGCSGTRTDASVTFTVLVPTGVKVDVTTINGSIGVAATAPVRAHSVNGTIKVATSVGPVDAETVNGNVDVRMTTLGADGPVRAKSVNGSASAYLPEKFDGAVEMTTVLGSITSDFAGGALTDGNKKFVATLGTGGRSVNVETVTGSAALHKLKADGTVAP